MINDQRALVEVQGSSLGRHGQRRLLGAIILDDASSDLHGLGLLHLLKVICSLVC